MVEPSLTLQDYLGDVRAERDRLAGEVEALRGSLLLVGRRLPGVLLADDVSSEFLAHVPDELYAALTTERARRERAEGALHRCLLPLQMEMAYRDLAGDPIPDEAVVLAFMGGGASDEVTAGDIRRALAPQPPAGDKEPR
jgi:hypothetical protein